MLIRRGLHLRVEFGLLSGIDLTSDDLGTKMMASVLAAVSDTDATLDLPGLLAGHLRTTGDETVRQALASGQTIRSGHGYSVRITAPLALHRAALEQSAALADAGPTERKAHRVYAARVTVVQATRLHPPCPGETLRRDAFERKLSLRRSHIRPLRPGGTRSFTLRRRRPWLILTDHVEGAGGGVIVSAREASLMIRDCAAVLTFSRPRCRSAMS
ncbi:hypothetical protein ACBI99_45155 [Nonomuraea sp. ATR24]|uniref:hypothetical protein n=1 Tax=Nonomuraea TaxID=83681 RepID=UPI001C5E1A20|nr:hypothetical protein [Nonomuraea ceibae]